MVDELFSGFIEFGWDKAPWDVDPTFTPEEMQVLVNPALSATEAAHRIGCARHDVVRIRRSAHDKPPASAVQPHRRRRMKRLRQ